MQQDDLQQIKQIIEENNKNLATQESLDDLVLAVKSGFEQVDKRFEDVYNRLDSIDAKLTFIQKEIEDIKVRLSALETRTVEDSDVISSDVLNLQKRVELLEQKVANMSRT